MGDETKEDAAKAPRDVFDEASFGVHGGSLRPSEEHKKHRRTQAMGEIGFLIPLVALATGFGADMTWPMEIVALLFLILPNLLLVAALWGLWDAHRSTHVEAKDGVLTVRRGFRRVRVPLTKVQGFEVTPKEGSLGFIGGIWEHYVGRAQCEVWTLAKEPSALPVRLSTVDAPLFVDALEEMRLEAKRQEAGRHGYRGVRVDVAKTETVDADESPAKDERRRSRGDE